MTTNIKDYSTTQSSNTTLNSIDVNEGMLPSNLNNAIRALMKNTRDFANDSQWFEYGVDLVLILLLGFQQLSSLLLVQQILVQSIML
jgi:hypothetical protein